MSAPAPPRVARRVLAWALPDDARDHVVAELDEVFQTVHDARGARAADLWYLRETTSFSTRFLFERLRERATGGSLPPQH